MPPDAVIVIEPKVDGGVYDVTLFMVTFNLLGDVNALFSKEAVQPFLSVT